MIFARGAKHERKDVSSPHLVLQHVGIAQRSPGWALLGIEKWRAKREECCALHFERHRSAASRRKFLERRCRRAVNAHEAEGLRQKRMVGHLVDVDVLGVEVSRC